MGAVYKAFDPQLKRAVAIKVIDPQANDVAAQRLFREAQSLAQLRHPHIIQVHEVGLSSHGQPFIVMELIDGQDFQRAVLKGDFDDPSELIKTLSEVAKAVHYAHQAGIIHRDVKPENIMIRRNGSPVLMDFGIARAQNLGVSLTQEGGLIGTPNYMPPEQADGSKVTPLSDVYSLGATLYFALAGQPPFANCDTVFSIVNKIFKEPPVPPKVFRPGADPALSQLCLEAMAKDPKQRPESAEAFACQLLETEAKTSRAPSLGFKSKLGALLLMAALVSALVWQVTKTQTAELMLSVDVGGVELFVGEQSWGILPTEHARLFKKLEPGPLNLRFRRAGAVLERTVTLKRGQQLTHKESLTAQLTIAGPKAHFLALKDPQGELTSLRGVGPWTVSMGQYTLLWERDNHHSFSQSLTLTPGSHELRVKAHPILWFHRKLQIISYEDPAYADVNGDGVLDLIVLGRRNPASSQYVGGEFADLIAINGRSGEELWRNHCQGNYQARPIVHHGAEDSWIMVSGLHAKNLGQLLRFRIQDGQKVSGVNIKPEIGPSARSGFEVCPLDLKGQHYALLHRPLYKDPKTKKAKTDIALNFVSAEGQVRRSVTFRDLKARTGSTRSGPYLQGIDSTQDGQCDALLWHLSPYIYAIPIHPKAKNTLWKLKTPHDHSYVYFPRRPLTDKSFPILCFTRTKSLAEICATTLSVTGQQQPSRIWPNRHLRNHKDPNWLDFDADGQPELLLVHGPEVMGGPDTLELMNSKLETKSSVVINGRVVSVRSCRLRGYGQALAVTTYFPYALKILDCKSLKTVWVREMPGHPLLRSQDLDGDGFDELILCIRNDGQWMIYSPKIK